MQDAQKWVERDRARVWHGFTQMSCYEDNEPVVVAAADGHELIGVDGRRYLDAISSLWVNTLGHRVPELDSAVRQQLDRVAHSTMLGNGSTVVVELAEMLAGVVPVDDPHFLFASDGASAVEQALKIALQYWSNRGQRHRTGFLCLEGGYHGDTVGALSLGSGFGAEVFEPVRFATLRAPGYADPRWSEAAVAMVREHSPSLAAVVLEPLVQGAGGMRVAEPGAVEDVGRACADSGVLLICDEVATGFGRTGSLFSSEQCGLRPDLLCLGKGLTAGYLPMSATVASGEVHRGFLGPDLGEKTLYHGHSYGGNALAAAVALRHLQLLDAWDVLGTVAKRSAELERLLQELIAPLEAVAEVRQRGLMAGVELAPPDESRLWGRRVCAASVRKGVLLRPLGDVVVVMPPLTVTSDELRRIAGVLSQSIREIAAEDA